MRKIKLDLIKKTSNFLLRFSSFVFMFSNILNFRTWNTSKIHSHLSIPILKHNILTVDNGIINQSFIQPIFGNLNPSSSISKVIPDTSKEPRRKHDNQSDPD